MHIEELVEKTPNLIHEEEIDPESGVLAIQARSIALNLGLSRRLLLDALKK